jgi:hypothetical protein
MRRRRRRRRRRTRDWLTYLIWERRRIKAAKVTF